MSPTRPCSHPPPDDPCECNRRLLHDLLFLLALCEVGASRARVVAVADRERRRIERDLHDGAQQRLVALIIRLELAAEQLSERDAATAAQLRGLRAEAEAALEDIRSVARGVYPAVLADHGLAAALRSAARHAPIPTTIHAEAGRRYRHEVEIAAYFCCLEAIQNATKHAAEATGIHVTLSERETRLAIEVRDDGPGFDPHQTAPGGGLTNMRDRLAARRPAAGLHASGRRNARPRRRPDQAGRARDRAHDPDTNGRDMSALALFVYAETAEQVLHELRAGAPGATELDSSGVVRVAADGGLTVTTIDWPGRGNPFWGLLWEALFGLVFLVPAAGSGYGSHVGGLFGAIDRAGLDADVRARIRSALGPRTSGLGMLLPEAHPGLIADLLYAHGGRVVLASLSLANDSELAQELGAMAA
jgi:uncharacterized membrane protein